MGLEMYVTLVASLGAVSGLNELFSTSALKWVGVFPKGRVSKHVSFMLLFCAIDSELYPSTTANRWKEISFLKGGSAAEPSFLSIMFHWLQPIFPTVSWAFRLAERASQETHQVQKTSDSGNREFKHTAGG